MNQSKNLHLEHWRKETKTQSRLNCYLTLNREYKLAEYLYSVRDTKQRQILTKYRLSDHQLAVETGTYRQTWLPREERVCGHCSTGEVETETHFLLRCEKFSSLTNFYCREIAKKITNFHILTPEEKMSVLLGEETSAPLAAKYVSACLRLRDSQSL